MKEKLFSRTFNPINPFNINNYNTVITSYNDINNHKFKDTFRLYKEINDINNLPYMLQKDREELIKNHDNIVSLAYHFLPTVRQSLAKCGYALDILVNDPDPYVREEVAKQGAYHEVLFKDPDSIVRAEIARQGRYLDILVNDPDRDVRKEVARQGKYLELLVYDPDFFVRYEVTESAIMKLDYNLLNILVNSNEGYIRYTIARHGFFLDKLIKDSDNNVRLNVTRYILNNRDKFTKEDFSNYINILCKDTDDFILIDIIDFLPLEDLPQDIYKHPSDRVRTRLAYKGYFLDKLFDDPSDTVRAQVVIADKEYIYTDIFLNDPSPLVRKNVAMIGKFLDILVNDESEWVRLEVARKGKYLDILSKDKSHYVRRECAIYNGPHLDILCDPNIETDPEVRYNAICTKYDVSSYDCMD